MHRTGNVRADVILRCWGTYRQACRTHFLSALCQNESQQSKQRTNLVRGRVNSGQTKPVEVSRRVTQHHISDFPLLDWPVTSIPRVTHARLRVARNVYVYVKSPHFSNAQCAKPARRQFKIILTKLKKKKKKFQRWIFHPWTATVSWVIKSKSSYCHHTVM